MPQTQEAVNQKVYTWQFLMICLSVYLFFASFNLIIPELPNYLSSLGGQDYKGLIISLFTVTAGLSRPFSGKLADKIGRVPVMVIGAAVSTICAFFYPLLSGVFGFLFLRFLHGFSTGFTPTGTSAYVADIIPKHRRGEAMGFIGLCSNLGMASGPAMGAWIAKNYGLQPTFLTSAAFGLAAMVLLSRMKESQPQTVRFHSRMLRIPRRDIFEPQVIGPSLVIMFCLFSFGIVLTVIPDFSEYLEIGNKGLFFTCFTLASICVRFFAGKASDFLGRVVILKISSLMLFGSMIFISFAHSSEMFIIGAILFGLSTGMCSPTVFAWTIDLSPDQHRGRALATMYIALEIGIGLGALMSGFLFNNRYENLPLVFWVGALAALASFVYLQFLYKAPNQAVIEPD